MDVLFSNLGFRPYIEVVIVDLLLLNMVLAILMDAYQVAWLNIPKGLATLTSVESAVLWHLGFKEVKSKASVMTTVPHQISEILRRRRLEREKKCVGV